MKKDIENSYLDGKTFGELVESIRQISDQSNFIEKLLSDYFEKRILATNNNLLSLCGHIMGDVDTQRLTVLIAAAEAEKRVLGELREVFIRPAQPPLAATSIRKEELI